MILFSNGTNVAIRWFITFLLACALQLIFVWAVKDLAIQTTLFTATNFPFIFLFCLTVTIIYSCNREAKDQNNIDNKLMVLTATNETNNENTTATNAERNNDEHDIKRSRPVLHYLMNLKVFLIFTVVMHHMAVAFGGIPAAPLVIGAYPNWFQLCSCFISLVPTFQASLNRKGRARFMYDRAQQYLLLSSFIIFTLNPYSQMIANSVAGLAIWYFPIVFHCWFLLWLIVFHWMFVMFSEASDKDKRTENDNVMQASQEQAVETAPSLQVPEEHLDVEQGGEESTATNASPTNDDPEDIDSPIPNAVYHWIAGGILGIINAAFSLSMKEISFYTIPTPPEGTLPSDTFLFVLGILAARCGWLRPPALSWNTVCWSYLGMTVIVLVFIINYYLLTVGRITMTPIGIAFAKGASRWHFCLDFSLVCLHLFHCWCNKASCLGKMMGEAAYTVYLIHYILTVIATVSFIKVYNSIYDEQVIYFVGTTMSLSPLQGLADGAIHLFAGFVVCTILVQVIVWPMAYGLKQIPGVKQVL